MAQCAAPCISGSVVRHGFNGLGGAKVHGVVAGSHLWVFGHHVVELFRHLDLRVDVDLVKGGAEDGALAVCLVAV